jgi:hypothetical protein
VTKLIILTSFLMLASIEAYAVNGPGKSQFFSGIHPVERKEISELAAKHGGKGAAGAEMRRVFPLDEKKEQSSKVPRVVDRVKPVDTSVMEGAPKGFFSR